MISFKIIIHSILSLLKTICWNVLEKRSLFLYYLYLTSHFLVKWHLILNRLLHVKLITRINMNWRIRYWQKVLISILKTIRKLLNHILGLIQRLNEIQININRLSVSTYPLILVFFNFNLHFFFLINLLFIMWNFSLLGSFRWNHFQWFKFFLGLLLFR